MSEGCAIGGGPIGDNEADPVEAMVARSGCLEQHYAVLECFAEKKDWRPCQGVLKTFQACTADYQRRQQDANRAEAERRNL